MMELLKQMINCLSNNHEWISLLVNAILGISTFVLTIVNLRLVRRQNEISEELSAIENDRDQPHFRISSTYEIDLDDGKYGTEILSVTNVGNLTIESCDVNADMFFQLKKNEAGKHSIIYVHVGDYYSLSYRGNVGEEEVYCSRTPGNHRKFYELYMDALNDRKEKDALYSIEKVLLLKISYLDIHNKKHEKYYRDKREIDKTEYDRINMEGSAIERFFTLSNISYAKVKEVYLKSRIDSSL